jgi:hypothetical protein
MWDIGGITRDLAFIESHCALAIFDFEAFGKRCGHCHIKRVKAISGREAGRPKPLKLRDLALAGGAVEARKTC